MLSHWLLLLLPAHRGAIDITQHNLAYVTALYTVNDKMRVELLEGGRTHADNDIQEGDLPMPLLLNNPAVSSRQSRLLLLLLVVSAHTACAAVAQTGTPLPLCPCQSAAIAHSEDAHKVSVLYKFLSEASDVFKDVYPIMLVPSCDRNGHSVNWQSSPLSAVVRAAMFLIARFGLACASSFNS